MCFATKLVKGIGLGGSGGNIPMALMMSRKKKKPAANSPSPSSAGAPLVGLGGDPMGYSRGSLLR